MAVRMIGKVEDITERKRMEKIIRESEERYRLILENSMDAILYTAPGGSIFSANQAACKMFQRTEEEICRAGRAELTDVDDPRLNKLINERKRVGKAKGEITLIRKDGTKFNGELSSSTFTDSNGNLRTSIIIRDITERKKKEAALRKSEDNLN